MTYSIVARCARSGQFGVAVATYSPVVGSNVPVAPLQDFYVQRKTNPTGLPKWWQKRMEVVPGWKPNSLIKVIPQQ